jgi:predicted flap endonuclease-1-like 5' DNA nuclease
MTMFIVQTVLLIAVAFGLGCLFGCWLKGRMAVHPRHSGAAAAVTHEGAAKTSTASELAAPRPHYEPATTPQTATALTSDPEAAAEPPALAQEPKPEGQGTQPGKKPARSRTAKSAAAKPAAGKRTRKDGATESKPLKAGPKASKAGKAGSDAAAKAKPSATAGSAAPETPDNLKLIKGIGPTIETKLKAAGITRFAQIAAWTKKEQAEFAEQLSFAGRIEREEWVRQAKVLAKGGKTDFSRRVAKGEVASSKGTKPKGGAKK